MYVFLIIVGSIVGLFILFVVYRYIIVHYQNRKINEKRLARVRPLYEKLNSGQATGPQDILPFAENILTRQMTFELLSGLDKKELFPEEYHTLIKAAESKLANWLEFPTELNACPDEMEHIKRISFDFDGQGNYSHFEVFKYRINEPHWAARYGWILGVVGPYFDDSQPYDPAGATFSRIAEESKTSPEEEARWVYEHIALMRYKKNR